MRPVPHGADVEISLPPTTLHEQSTESESSSMEANNDDRDATSYSGTPKLMSQSDLDELVRDLDLLKEPSELLGSRLHERNLEENVAPGTTFSS